RLAVMEFDAIAKPEGGASAVLGKLVALGEGQMVVEVGAGVLDQRIVQGCEKIIWRCRAVVLLRVQPAGCHGGVPGKSHSPLGSRPCRSDAERGQLRQQGGATLQHTPPGCYNRAKRPPILISHDSSLRCRSFSGGHCDWMTGKRGVGLAMRVSNRSGRSPSSIGAARSG